MELNPELIAATEAVLFACGDPVDTFRIADAVGVFVDSVPAIIAHLNERYERQTSGIKIIKIDTGYQMCTHERHAEQIRNILEKKRNTPLSNAAMEVLTVIAYNQPVSKGFVESVRGVDSGHTVNVLAEKGLIEEAGRLEIPGRPIAYRTTSGFLRAFGLESLSDLPELQTEPVRAALSEDSSYNSDVQVTFAEDEE